MFKQCGYFILLITTLGCSSGNSAEFRDPTEPANFESDEKQIKSSNADLLDDKKSSLDIEAILMPEEGDIVAVINGQVVKVGDSIGPNKVKAIQESRVILDGPEGEKELSLLQSPVKEYKE